MKKTQFAPAPEEAKKWLCPICMTSGKETLLGFVQGNIVRLKRKDFYVEFEGTGIISVNCYVCAARITETSSDYQEYRHFLDRMEPVELSPLQEIHGER